jgi:hypothetical protein
MNSKPASYQTPEHPRRFLRANNQSLGMAASPADITHLTCARPASVLRWILSR